MKTSLIVLIIVLLNGQLPSEPPPKFALLTVTYARNHSFETILNYLKHYTQTECYQTLISQICIIWNNEELPEDVGALDRQLYWRVPVYFYLTTNNSLNHRFRVPKEANAQTFYSLDDDILVDCQTLTLTYDRYMSSKQQGRGIVTNEGRNYGFFVNKKGQFQYQGHSYAKFYSIAQTGASFFPKHYLNLYYLDLEEVNLLRAKVDKITSCQDIFFMAITQHFYPEVPPKYYAPQANYSNTNPSVGLSRKPGLVALRTSCLLYLTEVLGYNPLRQYSKDETLYQDNWQFPNQKLILQTKIQGFINVPTVTSEQRPIKQPPNVPPSQPQNQVQQSDEILPSLEEEQSQIQLQPNSPDKIKDSTALAAEQQQINTQFAKKEQGQKVLKIQKQQVVWGSNFQIIVSIFVCLIIILCVLIARLYLSYRRLKRIKYHSSINEEELGVTDEQI